MTVIVVSNRVARGDEAAEGGLAAALLPAVKNSGAIWVGSSGRLFDGGAKDTLAEIQPIGAGALATVDMPREHYHGFYEGFANSALWPALHSRPDLIHTDTDDYRAYCAINAFMARALQRFAKPGSPVWVHDYHYLPLGAELRARGIDDPIGFFLHTPFPGPGVFANVPHHRELVEAMLAYDLIGFQTEADAENFRDYLRRELGMAVGRDGRVGNMRATRLATFPIGIDARAFAERATKAAAHPEIARLRASLQGRRLAIGVDRLDYSKGLPNRLRAFERMFEIEPSLRKTVSMLQIAVPTRVHIPAYRQLKNDLAALIGEINGRVAEIDWTPIRYLNKSFPQSMLAGFYRSAQIGLVTPFNDGMNLVAKEYVAAQNPLDPGVLVLSEFAGAARQLDAALLVNPHDVDAMAHTFVRALAMPRNERRERWQSMIGNLESSALDSWFDDFVSSLTEKPKVRRIAAPAGRPAAARRAPSTGIEVGKASGL